MTVDDTAWPLQNIQGLVLRGYRMPFIRYFALSVVDLTAARAFLAAIADPATAEQSLQSAQPWTVKPTTCLNIAFTWTGLKTLGLPASEQTRLSKNIYSNSFTLGAKARATYVGDIGESAPANWRTDDTQFDLMLILFAQDETSLGTATTDLAARFAAGFGALDMTRVYDSQDLPDENIYFGYRDNISQPQVAGSPFAREPDGGQTPPDPGAFMLGMATPNSFYASVYQPLADPPPSPAPFDAWGCYAAFRMLEQDCDGFQRQIESLAPSFGQVFGITDSDTQQAALMAKLCGRWPNGAPLMTNPINGDTIPAAPPVDQINNFMYGADQGQGCPYGAHIRRCNPRDTANVSGKSEDHRILRRAQAYQIPYDATNRDSGERGLLGLFMGASLLTQFEFLQNTWLGTGFVTLDPADPLIGNRGDGVSFPITTPTAPFNRTKFTLNRFITTKASAYLLLPGIPGVAWIAGLTSQPATAKVAENVLW